MQGLLDHIVINIEDDERIIDFYTRILMLPAERLEEYRAGEAPFPSVRINPDTVIDLFPRKLWKDNSSVGEGSRAGTLNHFCLSLARSDWESLHLRLRENLIPLKEGPVRRWGARGTGTSIFFCDPEGNTIEARYYEENDKGGKCLLGS